MKREVRQIKDGVIQVTLEDSRWYRLETEQGYKYVPSVSWISKFTPINEGLLRWYGEKGYEGAKEAMNEAGGRGGRVHSAISAVLEGATIHHGDTFSDPDTGSEAELTEWEYQAVLAFVDWYAFADVQEVLWRERTVFGDGYAGTIDLVCVCGDPQKPYRGRTPAAEPGLNLIDFKTSKGVFTSHHAQLGAYATVPEIVALSSKYGALNASILQIGNVQNAAGWKRTEIDWLQGRELFDACRVFWSFETRERGPKTYELPIEFSLTHKEVEK